MNARYKLFLPLIVFIVIVVVFLSLQKRMASGDYDPSELPSALVGKSLPDFNLTQLENAERQLSLNDLNELPALLNVWATWCIACKAEHAYLNQLAKNGITIYGLNYKDARLSAMKWLEKLGNPYRLNVFDDEGVLGLNMGVYGAPETYVLDENGIVRYRHVGVMNDRVWKKIILPLGISW